MHRRAGQLRSLGLAFGLLVSRAAAAPDAAAQDLTVSAAISLKDALGEIASAFEAASPGVDVNLNLGASGDLQRQIEAGAPVDVYVSAAASNMDVLASRGGIDSPSRRDVACNKLVLITPADAASRLSSLEELTGAERIAIGNPRTVPAGQYAREALVSAGLWLRLEPKYVFTENVRQALEYVARGEVEAGFVYVTDARVVADRVRVAFVVDPATYEPIVYPAAIVAGSRRRDLARKFVEFLSSPAAGAALEKQGFTLPPCAEGRHRN